MQELAARRAAAEEAVGAGASQRRQRRPGAVTASLEREGLCGNSGKTHLAVHASVRATVRTYVTDGACQSGRSLIRSSPFAVRSATTRTASSCSADGSGTCRGQASLPCLPCLP